MLVVFLCRFFLLSLRVFKHKACIYKLALGLRTIKKATKREVQNLLDKIFCYSPTDKSNPLDSQKTRLLKTKAVYLVFIFYERESEIFGKLGSLEFKNL